MRFSRSVAYCVLILTLISMVLLGGGKLPAIAAPDNSGALVLVNSTNLTYYPDFEHFIQPYLDHFGIPYTVLDISGESVPAVLDYAVIIVGHRQLDVTGTALTPGEQDSILAAVEAGVGLVNFDNDLWASASVPRYSFVDDIFDFDYVAPASQSGVSFVSETGGAIRINCWEDDHQIPVLTTTTNSAALNPTDNQWTEFLYATRGYPGLFAGYDESPPLLRCFGPVPDGDYTLSAHLYWSHNLRYFWGYSSDAAQAYSYDVTSGVSGDFADYALGTVTVTGGEFNLYIQNADPLTGGVDYPYWAWSWIDLTPSGAPPAPMHYITERHAAGETISTGSMAMAGITVPAPATTLAMSGSQPFLAVTTSGLGRAVQWGSYNWMSHAVKGPIYGLDDLVWRSIVWAARKPFVMQGLPPFVTMRVDDESGPFDWIDIANEFGIKPWAGLFYHNVDATEAADLSTLVRAGMATASVHAKSSVFFYYNHGVGNFSDAEMAANYAEATAWHDLYDIPISKYVLPHYYEFGTNVFQGLANWGVEFVGTHMVPGNGYGAAWVMNGPYRLYETGSSSGTRPVYYADFLTVPGHSEFDGDFFNCVTEIRDDAGYEWYPDNNVAATIGKGTRQTVRALDSMALATLFTHGYFLPSITEANWRAILQGITDNIASYNPIYVTMDHACQYVRAMHTSNIASSTYDPDTRQLTTSFSGSTDMPTMFYLFTDQGDDIVSLLIDVPAFSGSTTVDYTLAGELNTIVVTPNPAAVVTGSTQQFTATGYDADNNPIPNLPFTWEVINGGGTISARGLFTAGAIPGTYANTVRAMVGGIAGLATVEVVPPALDHFTFDPIANPQYINTPFAITIRARDQAGSLLSGYIGQASLSDSTGTLTPIQTGSFVGGVWTGSVTIAQLASGVTLHIVDGAATGTSGAFNVQAAPTFYTMTSPSYQQFTDAPFDVTINAYAGTTINLAEDNHQDPVLLTTTDYTTWLPDQPTPSHGNWVEFYYAQRGYPSILAHHLAFEQAGLPVMRFYASGIPDGTYEVIANLYDNAPMRYYYGFDASNPRALSIVLPGGATGTQHREYSLGTVDVTGNTFNIYVQDADLLPGGSTYPYFGWAWIHLVPVENEVFFYCADDTHQDPVLLTTTDPLALQQDGNWTEFLYTPSRPYASILGHVNEVLPVMRFYTSGIPNGTYEVIANLYDNAPMRYYYGYSPSNPIERSVDVPGGAPGTQHREYSLGTVTITDGVFSIYVRDADRIGSTGYEFFGWAWIRLVDHYVNITSSSPTMQFDGNGNGTFGEPGDNVVSIAVGSATVAVVDPSNGTDVAITATDALGRSGSTLYDINGPTAITLVSFTATPQAESVRLEWETAVELANLGFNLYRSEKAEGPYTRLNASLIPPQFPGEILGGIYTWLDENVEPGHTYYYQLEDIEIGDVASLHGPVSVALAADNPTSVNLRHINGQTGGGAAGIVAVLALLGWPKPKRKQRHESR